MHLKDPLLQVHEDMASENVAVGLNPEQLFG